MLIRILQSIDIYRLGSDLTPFPLSMNGEGERTLVLRASLIWRGEKDARVAGVIDMAMGMDICRREMRDIGEGEWTFAAFT